MKPLLAKPEATAPPALYTLLFLDGSPQGVPMGGGADQSVVEEKFEEMQAAKESPEIPEVDEDGKPLTKKARTALLRAAEKEREKRLSAASDRIKPEVTSAPCTVLVCVRRESIHR